MTDKEKLEKVRAEIERRKKEVEDNIFELGNSESERIGLFDNEEIYNDILSFIDSMQKEPKVCMYSTANYTNADRLTLCKDCEELCKYNQKTAAESLGISQEAYDEIVDKCLYGSEVELVDNGDLPKEEPVSDELEEAVNAYIGYAPDVDESLSTYGKRQAFKAGANWQKQKDESYTKSMYKVGINTGKELMKQQMIAKAVKVNISNASIISLPVNCDLKVCDKVLIIKEE